MVSTMNVLNSLIVYCRLTNNGNAILRKEYFQDFVQIILQSVKQFSDKEVQATAAVESAPFAFL